MSGYYSPDKLVAHSRAPLPAGRLLSAAGMALVCLLVVVSPARTSPLRGNIQVSATQTDNAGDLANSIDQQHSLGITRNLTPYVTLNGALGLSRFTTDLGEGANIWRKQVSPSADLRWAHPLFTAGLAFNQRRLSSNNNTTDILLSGLVGDFRLQKHEWPLVTLRVASDESHNRFNRSTRDMRGHSAQFVAQHTIRQSRLNYTLNSTRQNVYSSNLRTASTGHRLTWSQQLNTTDGRLRTFTEYRLSHRRSSDRLIDEDRAVRSIDIITSLYAYDATPDLGALDTVATLSDGNSTDPAEPAIAIGRGTVDQNLGLDFGYPRRVDGLYIYTDRPSGSGLGWTIWTSIDNETWDRLPAGASVTYNAAFLRYEILFDSVETRYVKAVNFGTNDILEVLVSEIEALEEITLESETNREQTTHVVSLSSNYRVSGRINMGLDFDLRAEPGGSFSTSRDQYFSTYSVSHEISSVVSHAARIQMGWKKYHTAVDDETDLTANYSANIRPIETINVRLGASSNQSRVGEHDIQEFNGVTARSDWQIYPGLSLQIDGRYSRNNLFAASRTYDSWTYRVAGQATLRGGIRFTLASQYRSSIEINLRERRIRRTLDGTIDLDLTRSIALSSRIGVNDDENAYSISQFHTVSWRMSESFTLGAQFDLDRTGADIRVERSNIRLNYRLSGRTNIYAGGTRLLSENSIDRDIVTAQLGLRTGF